jgi:hypothetical protein
MLFQGDRSQTYQLQHYHDDVFSYPLVQLENAQRGCFHTPDPKLFLLKFEPDQLGKSEIVGVVWNQAPEIPEDTAFSKEGASPLNFDSEQR